MIWVDSHSTLRSMSRSTSIGKVCAPVATGAFAA
jgi:hypothetical protein